MNKKVWALRKIIEITVCMCIACSTLTAPVHAVESGFLVSGERDLTEREDHSRDVDVFGDEQAEFSEGDIIGEYEEGRGEFEKHFLMKDGKKAAVSYDEPVHEIDEEGKYREIDNTLHKEGEYYVNAKNRGWTARLALKASEEVAGIEEDGKTIRWGIVGANGSEGRIEKEEEGILTNKGVSETIRYEEVLEGVDVEYQVSQGKLKENIILKEAGRREITFRLDVEGYTVETDKEGTIVLRDEDNEKGNYEIRAPYMVDAKGNYHDGIKLSVEDGKVRMVMDEQWLTSEDRAYPVTVDPTITKQMRNSSVDNTSVNSQNPTSNAMYQYGALYVGREASSYGKLRGVFKFSLPTLKESDMVVHARVILSQLNYYGSGSVTVRTAPLTKSLALSSLTWNKLSGNTGKSTDYAKVSSSTVGKWFSFDVTRCVKQWYSDGKNYGLALISSNESGTYKYATFVTTRNTGLSSRSPYASVSYLSKDGMEDFLSYQTVKTEAMGTLNVGDANGNLIYSYTDSEMSGNWMPVGIRHIYNHHQRDNATCVNGAMKYGKGFRLNVNLKVERVSDTQYRMTDDDGTVHYFNKDSDSGKYLKEFDTEVKMSVLEDSYEMENGSYRYTFTKTDGMVSTIEDRNSGKRQLFTYDTEGRLVGVTDGAMRETTLSYDNDGYLTEIVYAGGRTVSYTYDTQGHLENIRATGKPTVTYTYDSDDKLTGISSQEEGSVAISYATTGLKRVSRITRYGKNGTEGESMSFSYGSGTTTVSDEAGYSMTMMFDSSGHTVSVRDSEGNGLYGSYGNNESNSHDSLTFESKMQTSTVNVLRNHGPIKENTIWSGNYSIVTIGSEETDPYFTGLAFRLGGNGTMRQNVNTAISAGQSYTLSAYVKAEGGLEPEAEGEYGYYIGVEDTEVHHGEVKTKTDGWTRISYTYTAENNIAANGWQAVIGVENITGAVLVKNIQLEKGTVANRYNFVENGHFYDSASTARPQYWTLNDNMTDDDKTADGYQGNGYEISGDADSKKALYQTLKIKGNEGDNFVVSAWGSGNRMPNKSLQPSVSGNTKERTLGIELQFVRLDGTVGENGIVQFSAMTTGWQYLSGSIKAPHAYKEVRVLLRSGYQLGKFTFDNVQLYMEGFGYYYEHDDKGNVTLEQDAQGNITRYTYTTVNVQREGTSVNEEDVVSHIEYKRANDTTYLKTTDFTYNDRGKVQTETYTDMNLAESDAGRTVVTEYHYDESGNLTHTVINGQTKYESGHAAYDGNYLESYTDERGKTTTYNVNPQDGLLQSMTDAAGNEREYTYVTGTDLVASMRESTMTVEYSYDSLGHLSAIERRANDATGNAGTYGFTYDEFGKLESVSVGSDVLVEYRYMANNRELAGKQYANGHEVSYTYDTLDRVTSVREDGETVYSWEYMNEGKIGRIIDHTNGTVTEIGYDLEGNVTEERREDGTVLTNRYNKLSELTGRSFRKGILNTSTEALYNPRREIESVTWTTMGNESTATYHRDFLRRVDGIRFEEDGEEVLGSDYEYLEVTGQDGEAKTTNVITEVRHRYGNQSKTYGYVLDDVGNITDITEGSQRYRYGYDDTGELTREDDTANNRTMTYDYDGYGNLTEVREYGYTDGSLENLPYRSVSVYTYGNANWKDQLTAYNGNAISYDANGNPLTYHDGKQFSWSFRKLTGYTDGTTSVQYTYNAAGIRTSKTVDGVRTEYTVSGNGILTETTGNSYTIYEYDALGLLSSFVHNGERYIYLRNGTNDITGILDEEGNAVAWYRYDGWGNTEVSNLTEDEIGDVNPFRYRGYYYDDESGFYYLNHRYYDPEVRRFISPDEVENLNTGKGSLSLNLYAYCENNPINKTDDEGECAIEAMLAGALVGVGVQLVGDIVNNAFSYVGSGKFVGFSPVEDYVASAVSGAVSVLPMGKGASIVVSVAITFTSDVVSYSRGTQEFNFGDLVCDVILSAISTNLSKPSRIMSATKKVEHIYKTSMKGITSPVALIANGNRMRNIVRQGTKSVMASLKHSSIFGFIAKWTRPLNRYKSKYPAPKGVVNPCVDFLR